MAAGITWVEKASGFLRDSTTCPLCTVAKLREGRCPSCGADLNGPLGAELWKASTAAADALGERGRILRVAAAQAAGAQAEVARPAGSASAAAPASASVTPAPDRGPGATLQSVIATAGAALFAVAAIVFSSFTPELADLALRTTVIGGVALLFLGGAWLLARRRLQFSAEAVGGLGVFFLGLAVHATAQLLPGAGPWATAAIATAFAASALLLLARLVRLRIWLWASLPALASVPAMLGFAVSGALPVAVGYVGSAFLAAALSALFPRLSAPFAKSDTAGDATTALRAEVTTLSWLQLIVTLLGIGMLQLREGLLALAAVLAMLAAAAVLAACFRAPRAWAFLAGVLVTGAGAGVLAKLADVFGGEIWAVTWWSTGAVLALVLTAVVPLPRRTPRRPLAIGSASMLGVLSIPPLVGVLVVAIELVRAFDHRGGFDGDTSPIIIALAVIGAGLALFAGLAGRGARRSLSQRAVDALGGREPSVHPLGAGEAPRGAGESAEPGAGSGQSLEQASGTRGAPTHPLGAGVAAEPVVGTSGSPALAGPEPSATRAPASAQHPPLSAAFHTLQAPARALSALFFLAAAFTLVAGAPILLGWRVAIALTLAAAIALVLRLSPVGGKPERIVALVAAHLSLLVAMILVWREPEIVPVAGAATLLAIAAVALAVPTGRRFLHVGAAYAYALLVVATSLGLAGIGGIPQVCLTASAGLLGAIAATFLPRISARNWQAVLVVATVPFGIAVVQVVFERNGWTALSTALMFVLALSLLLTRRPGLTGVLRVLAAAMLVPSIAVTLVCLGAQLLVGSGSPVVLPLIAAVIALVLSASTALRRLLIARGRGPRTADAARLSVEASSLLTGFLAVLLALVREAAGLGTAVLVLLILGVGGVGAALMARRRYGWWLAGAAFAGAIQAFRWGVFLELTPVGTTAFGGFLASFVFSLLAALVLLGAGVVIRRATGSLSRWIFAPVPLALAVGLWPAIARDWSVIWGMWGLMIVLLVLVVLAAAPRGRILPPVWYLFGLAFLTGIVAWSPRELRVEWFSLPMGAFLLLAGAIGWRAGKGADAASAPPAPDGRPPLNARSGSNAGSLLNDWPHGRRGSWALLAPGIVVMMSASIVATFTDPLTWRAILVMVLALAAILLGAAKRLAAPFLLGLVVLPIENVFVFSVQLGRGIESMPWWITLALMGAVLLIIAITGERREGAGRGVAARVRDLR